MIIIGNKDIPYLDITTIKNKEDIQKTKPNSMVSFIYDIEIIKYCYENNIKCAVVVKNIKEAIFSNSLMSTYILVENSISKEIQTIAEHYMFDSKILEIIQDDDSIENVAKNGIDGVLYKELIKEI